MSNFLEGVHKSNLARVLIDNTPVAYIILDNHYRIHYINENFLKLRKLSPETTIGEVCYNISNGGVHCRQCAVEQALRTGEKAMIARKDVLPGGNVRFIDDYAVPLSADKDGKEQFVLEIMVNRTPEMLARERRDKDYNEILFILTSLLDAKDKYTATHSACVHDVTSKLALAMGLSAKEAFDVSIAAMLHDIGKVSIPDAIINKTSRLTDEEFEKIKTHPSVSYDMLYELSSFENIKNIVRHHHERVDGRGYPDGLTGDQLSMGAKIVAVADTYDAMTSTRSYRKALTHEYAMSEIQRVAGTQLDPDVVQAFLAMDWSELGDNISSSEPSKEKKVERILSQEQKSDVKDSSELGDFTRSVDMDRIIEEIIENTPCGYVLMTPGREILFASKYFLDYMGVSEGEILGKLCYEASGSGNLPCNPCAISRALETGTVAHQVMEQKTRNGFKIFDLFGMPLVDEEGQVTHVIEIIIDRTQEVMVERQREHDFKKLVELLESLLEEQRVEAKETGENFLSDEIQRLHARLDELMTKR